MNVPRDSLSVSAFFFVFSYQTAPLWCRWPLCGSRWHYWAVTSHPLPSGACPPTSPSLFPFPCLLHPVFHSPCALSVVFGNGVIIGQPISHFSNELSVCSFSVSRYTYTLFQSPLPVTYPWRMCVTFLPCPLQTLPIMPSSTAT